MADRRIEPSARERHGYRVGPGANSGSMGEGGGDIRGLMAGKGNSGRDGSDDRPPLPAGGGNGESSKELERGTELPAHSGAAPSGETPAAPPAAAREEREGS